MKSRAVIWVVFAAVVYCAVLWAHERIDRERVRETKTPLADDFMRRLMRDGRREEDALRLDVSAVGAPWEPLNAILSGQTNTWENVARDLVQGRRRPSDAFLGSGIVSPRGKILAGSPPLRIRGLTADEPQRIRIVDLADDSTVATHDFSQPDRLPEKLLAETRYRIELLGEDDRVIAMSTVEVASAAEAAMIRRESAAVAALIKDLRLRRYAFGRLSMNHGFLDAAASLLVDQMGAPTDLRRENELAWRQLFLHHRRGDISQSRDLASKLRGT